MTAAPRRLLVLTAGVGSPSSSRLLADRLAAATESEAREPLETTIVELRDHATDLAQAGVTRFTTPALEELLAAAASADAVIAVTPIFNASYSGLFKTFFDVLEKDALAGVPVLLGATAGTPRHSLALEYAVRPLLAYLRADVMPTAVFAATGDWGADGSGQAGDDELARRVERAGRELATALAQREPRRRVTAGVDDLPPLETDFEAMLRGLGAA